MRGAQFAALGLLAALLVGAFLAPRSPEGALPTADGGLLVLLVPPSRQIAEDSAWAVVPGRDLETAYRTGRLRPEPGGATLGPALRRSGVRTVAVGPAAARLLDAPDARLDDPRSALGPGVCVVAEWTGPLPETAPGQIALALPTGVLPGQSLPPVVVRGAGVGALVSPSTRTVGLVAATDVPATIGRLLGKELEVGVGRAAGIVIDDAGLPRRIAVWERQNDEQALRRFLPWALAALVALGVGLRRRAVLASAAAAPLALGVAPALALWTDARWAVYAVAAALTALAIWLPERGRLRGLAWASVAFFALDGLAAPWTGGFLLARSPLSWAPVEAARFYGIGNEAAGAWLGATGALAALEGGSVGIALLAGAAVGIGAPGLGANAGCALAALVGLVVQAAAALPARRRLVTLAAGALAVAGLTALVAVRDGAQGVGRRSHIGEAVAAAQGRGVGALVAVARRKAALNLRLLVGSPWSVLLLAGAAGVVRRRRRQAPGLWAVDGAALVLNDSGVLAAAVCGLWLPGVLESENDDAATEQGLRGGVG